MSLSLLRTVSRHIDRASLSRLDRLGVQVYGVVGGGSSDGLAEGVEFRVFSNGTAQTMGHRDLLALAMHDG